MALFLLGCTTKPQTEQQTDFAASRSLLAQAQKSLLKEDVAEAELFLEQALDSLTLDNESDPNPRKVELFQEILSSFELLFASGKAKTELAPIDFLPSDTGVIAPKSTENIKKDVDSSAYTEIDIPFVMNERIQAQVEYLSQRAPRFMSGSLTRKTLYDSLIYAELAKKGMPADIIYLALVESGYKTNAYSSAKAGGIWQFIPETGRRYGLAIDWWVDMRRDPLSSTKAALSYLTRLHNEFGDWLMAMAAYNCGEGRVRRQVREGKTSYWDMKLPKETMKYVPRILAAAIIGHSPEKFGISFEKKTLPPKDSVSVSHCLTLDLVAKMTSSSSESIKQLNPSLSKWCTPSGVKNFVLYIPKGTRDVFLQKYQKLDKKKLTRWHRHKVKWGDNLGAISDKYGISVKSLRLANNIRGNRIRAGQYLVIPIPEGAIRTHKSKSSKKKKRASTKGSFTSYKVRKGDSFYSISRKFNVALQSVIALNPKSKTLAIGQKIKIPNKAKAKNPSKKYTSLKHYRIKKGDSFYSIAKKVGIATQDLLDINKGTSSSLSVGQKIQVPKFGKTKASQKVTKSQAKAGASQYKVRSGDNAYVIAKKLKVTLEDLMRWNGLSSGSRIFPGMKLLYYTSKKNRSKETNATYIVRNGDSFWSLSKKFGTTVKALQILNGKKKLYPGMKLRIK